MTAPEAPPGFRSEEAKRAYGSSVTMSAVLFLILQIGAPMAAMLVAMPAFFLSGAANLAQNQVESAVRWNGELWSLSRSGGLSGPGALSLQRRGDDNEPKTVGPLSDPDADLLAGTDRLWVLEETRPRFVKDGELRDHGTFPALGARTDPFLSGGMPAVVERNPDGTFELRVLGAEGWSRAGKVRLPDLAQGVDFREVIRFLGAGGALHLFRHDGFTVVHRVARVDEPAQGDVIWTSVGEAPGAWRPFLYQGAPALAVAGARNNTDGFVRVFVLRDGAWSLLFKSGLGLARELAANPVEGTDRIEIAVEGMTGGLKRFEMSAAGDILATRKSGDAFPFGTMMIWAMALPQALSVLIPLGFALVLSRLMKRHRTSDHQGEELASLFSRAMAGLLDYLLAFAPAVPAVLSFVAAFGEEGPDAAAMPELMLALAGGMAGSLLVMFGFAVMEGLSGVTPGKWVAGIRVVGADDLRPCGVGRAVVRKLLLVADGFFNGMVGLLVAAFNEKRQRVGDLVAKTVVVKRLPPRP
jgi:uncharacterized RDD family membrane protein YckC